jgi:hypothetical protein
VALDTSVGLDVSSELADGLVVLRDWLEAVNKSLRISAIPKVVQGIHTALESFFVDNIVMKQHFSMEGARQFETDLKATRSVLQSFASLECFPRSSSLPFSPLRMCTKLDLNVGRWRVQQYFLHQKKPPRVSLMRPHERFPTHRKCPPMLSNT